ncbi:hypothetical protein CMI40_01525 [Candidatus Pacearchaeota archaeon]|jgi:hypothetical protein|nr:hypothetical protein [Candidatus Pacearchaeota archaeon]|tara:strand:- start:6841 stop:7356 length:516 start_codon:yes stop_codon:yes gene_type:complete
MKRGQVWVETVIYTLIAFVMIGAVLAFVKPKIEEIRDKAIIEQTIGVIKDINSKIVELNVAGNKRIIELGIKRGTLTIDGEKDLIVFELESKNVYSQPGEDIHIGNIIAHTKKRGTFNTITLMTNHSEYNVTYQGEDKLKTISQASTPYRLSISNIGEDNGKSIIDFDIIN